MGILKCTEIFFVNFEKRDQNYIEDPLSGHYEKNAQKTYFKLRVGKYTKILHYRYLRIDRKSFGWILKDYSGGKMLRKSFLLVKCMSENLLGKVKIKCTKSRNCYKSWARLFKTNDVVS